MSLKAQNSAHIVKRFIWTYKILFFNWRVYWQKAAKDNCKYGSARSLNNNESDTSFTIVFISCIDKFIKTFYEYNKKHIYASHTILILGDPGADRSWGRGKIGVFRRCAGNTIRGTLRQFSENICSEDDLRSRIFGTFVVQFLACLPLLGFSNI